MCEAVTNALSLYPSPAAAVPFERRYTLTRNVPAIQMLSGEAGDAARLGLMTQLPAGIEVNESGPGFNDRTVRIRCGNSSYYVFIEDLESQRKPAASAALAG